MDHAFLVIYLIFFTELVGSFVLSFYGMFNYALDKKQSLNYRLLLIPAFMLASLPLLHSLNYLIELVLIALIVHTVLMSLGLAFKENLSNKIIFFLALVIPPFFLYSGLLDALYGLGLIVLGVFYTSFIIVFSALCFKLHGSDDYLKSDFLNIVAVFSLILVFNLYGLMMMLALMALALALKAIYAVRLSRAYRKELDQRYTLIQEDFDEEVRKKVRTQLYYMEQTQERMAEIAKLDAMTGVYNKKAFFHALEDRIADKRTGTFSLLIFDIDRFKDINDTYGHVVGDKCIVRVAGAAKESIREGDLIGRYGGDEFFILLSEADLRTAIEVAHRLRKKVENLEAPKLTVSIGISNFPADAGNVKDLISHADRGLYQAKDKGRNTLGYVSSKPENKAD